MLLVDQWVTRTSERQADQWDCRNARAAARLAAAAHGQRAGQITTWHDTAVEWGRNRKNPLNGAVLQCHCTHRP